MSNVKRLSPSQAQFVRVEFDLESVAFSSGSDSEGTRCLAHCRRDRTSRSGSNGLVGSVAVNDPDAIWKPGYDGPPPISTVPDDPADGPGEQAPAGCSRRWRFAVGVALAVVVAGAVVVLDPLGLRDDPNADGLSGRVIEAPDRSVFGGAAARRLPLAAPLLWSVDIPSGGDHWVEVIRHDLVIAAVVEPSEVPTTTVVALDATTGDERWVLPLAGEPTDVAVVGAVGDVLVLEQSGTDGSTLVGVDVMTGDGRWSTDAVPNDGHVGLVGTPFVARLPISPDVSVSLIEATSGRDVGAIVSDPSGDGRPGGWSSDGQGTWFVTDDGVVSAYDLRSELGESTVIAPAGEAATPSLVVDGRLAFVDDDGTITFAGVDDNGPVTVSADVPAMARSLTPVSDSAFVVAAPGTISGVGVEGDSADMVWQRTEGVVMDTHPVVGGSLIQVASQSGGAIQLVDGLTGTTIEDLTMTPGVLQALLVAGDGAVVIRSSDFGARVAGIDFDGNERWSIPGLQPVLVGDRVVVRATSSDGVGGDSSSQLLGITAYGDVN
jgi:outer membrane protein assembly factor BamB